METVIATVISILFSILISIVVTRYYTKIQMKKKEVTHFLINSYDVGKGLKDVFPEFSISYKNEVLAKHVRVYEGCFMNTGNKDVYNNDNIEIQMAFPKDYIVKAVNVDPSSDDLIVNVITSENSNKVIFLVKELFKTNKRFKYSAIVECPNDIAATNSDLVFEHKLPDTVINDGDKLYENRKKRQLFILILFTPFLSFIPGFLSGRLIYSPLPYNFHSFKYIGAISFTLAFIFFYIILYYLSNYYIDSKNIKFRDNL
jgi:hypothetical protein